KLGGHFLIPEDPQWPAWLAELYKTEPFVLRSLCDSGIPPHDSMIRLVAARVSTSNGSAATDVLATPARNRGRTVVCGGAYGIDAYAHRIDLYAAGSVLPTIAVLAGGIDRFYPSCNVELLREIAASCVLISELPPGMRPNRYRF